MSEENLAIVRCLVDAINAGVLWLGDGIVARAVGYNTRRAALKAVARQE